MNLPYILVAASIAALILLIALVWKRPARIIDLDRLAFELRSINVDAYLNLIDEREERYLREHLSPGTFRSVHRRRMFAAMEYTWYAARNARLLSRLAEGARLSSDPELVTAAENLQKQALALRLSAFQMMPQLFLSAVLPGAHSSPDLIAATYDSMSCNFFAFMRLHAVAAISEAA